jgi:hypothetical protein
MRFRNFEIIVGSTPRRDEYFPEEQDGDAYATLLVHKRYLS